MSQVIWSPALGINRQVRIPVLLLSGIPRKERLSAVPAEDYGAQYCKVVAAKARNAADLLHLTLAALRSNAEAQEAREVRV